MESVKPSSKKWRAQKEKRDRVLLLFSIGFKLLHLLNPPQSPFMKLTVSHKSGGWTQVWNVRLVQLRLWHTPPPPRPPPPREGERYGHPPSKGGAGGGGGALL